MEVRAVVASGDPAGVRVSQASARQTPGDRPDRAPTGAPGDRVVVDGGGLRHGGLGDGRAVVPDRRAPVSLVPGVAPVAVGVEVRDRYRDVPVSPA
ncbi:hypothetical protein [Streptomyces sp. NBC_00576]|uniref:hypothetical protein n=1 Tax=Streptomyces sp. NBC_00576 TaxID=2903665 RepID=UPI002E804B7E|nr:hypothetical protein [Streptomyces sp. NBC_00576]WUB71601.1 hypothetical protein OG734_16675 [Streptomyces sp. NBC_00576]